MKRKNLYIENLGCAKNQVDAEVLCTELEKNGYSLVEEAEDADLVLVNTCGFIELAKSQSIDTFFSLRERCPKAKIVLCGCLAQRYADNFEKELPEADAVFGNRDLAKIGEVVANLEKKERKTVRPEYPDPDSEIYARNRFFNFPGSAYLKISEGCNHCCGYCAIPLIRGPLRSRKLETVIKEAEYLVSKGIKEINLIAQDLAAYGWDWDGKSHFEALIEALSNIEGDFAVRLLYIHPDWMTDSMIKAVKNSKKILHYFDIPFQHASENILKPMNRTGNSESYYELVQKIRAEIPDAVIRTTIMLGFPGETEEDFKTVENFIKKCRFTWMGGFVYSLEEDTPAFSLTTEEEHEKLAKEASKRQKKLEKIQQKISSEELEKFVGTTQNVLIEENVEGEDLSIGRIYAQAPEVDGLTVVMGRDMEAGKIYKCIITKVNGMDLEAVKERK